VKPLAIDLFAGLGGWTDGLLAEGWQVIGFDIERHVYGEHRYPAQLVVQDVLTLHGSQFRDADLIVASPPCQFFSYTAMPWNRRPESRDMKTKLHKADPKHEIAYQDIVALVRRHAEHLSSVEMLAIAANMLGKLLAYQDQRSMTPTAAMEIIIQNIEEGNRQAITEVTNSKGRA
jgi:hypothetical protein